MKIRILTLLLAYNLPGVLSIANKMVSVNTNCTRELLQIDLYLGHPFKGIIFAKDFSEECGSKGDSTNHLKLTLPVSGCGIRFDENDGVLTMSVSIIAQMDQKLQQRNDIETVVKCTIPQEMMDFQYDNNKESRNGRNGRMRYLYDLPIVKVRAWLEIGGTTGDGLVNVGENTTLSVHTVLPRYVGAKIVDCQAFDGLGESSQKLFDEEGCPLDLQIMPVFQETLESFEVGWSKPGNEDIVEKVFLSTFHAFKFPDREIIHFSCGIQICNGKCSQTNCNDVHSKDSTKKLESRIEVFNSIKVSAPLIEIDRAEQNATALPSTNQHLNDVLCISSSKLAFTFCILGFIFLTAVLVAICCSLRYVSLRNRSRRAPTCSEQSGRRSIFSVISSSSSQDSSQIDSKLFSYGRVY